MDKPKISDKSAVFQTPWFELIRKTVGEDGAPYYSIATLDYVSVFAVTKDGGFPLVRQFRPAIEEFTLELPGGHVDPGETPAAAAMRELHEESGYVTNGMHLVGTLSPDIGRLSNRQWCFFAPEVEPDSTTRFQAPAGLESLVYKKSLRDLILSESAFCSALNRATILMAVAHGHIEL